MVKMTVSIKPESAANIRRVAKESGVKISHLASAAFANAERMDADLKTPIHPAPCSSCDLAYQRFHDERRVTLEAYIENRTQKHVKSGGNDSPSYRINVAYDGMRDLPGHSDRDIWDAAWKACLANVDVDASPPLTPQNHAQR